MTSEHFADTKKAEVAQKLRELEELVNNAFPGPSRAKSLVITKLDEARLWVQEIA